MEFLLVICLCLLVGSAQADGKEIEARRRSALDKNFMRFGRTYPAATPPYYHGSPATVDGGVNEIGGKEAALFAEPQYHFKPKRNANKETRTPVKNSNFLRFGRNNGEANGEDENPNVFINVPQIRSSNGFLRFGKSSAAYSKPQFIPAGAIWPLMNQQEKYDSDDYVTTDDGDRK